MKKESVFKRMKKRIEVFALPLALMLGIGFAGDASARFSLASQGRAVVWRARAHSAAEEAEAFDSVVKSVSATPNVTSLCSFRPDLILILR
jgi:hypothetical protein